MNHVFQNPIKLGMLGAGSFVQRRILPILKNVPSIQVTCLHKRNLEDAKRIASQFNIPKAVSSRQDLLNADIDAVFIATPNHCHEEDAIACARAHLPTLCEKPLAPTTQAIIRMQEAFSKHSTPLFVGQSLRFKPAVQKAKQLLHNGDLGELLHINAYFALPVPKTNWRYKKSQGGGVLQDIGVHLIDLIHFISKDMICSIHALANPNTDPDEGEHTVTAIGKLTNGACVSFECSMNQPLRSGFEVIGTKARLISIQSLRQTDLPGESLTLIREDDSTISIPLESSNIYANELTHFAEILKNNMPSIISADVALANQKTIEASYESIYKNPPLQF